MMNFRRGFNENKFKPALKMAAERLRITSNRKHSALKVVKEQDTCVGFHAPAMCQAILTLNAVRRPQVLQRDVAQLLEQDKEEKARLKVEVVIRLAANLSSGPQAPRDEPSHL